MTVELYAPLAPYGLIRHAEDVINVMLEKGVITSDDKATVIAEFERIADLVKPLIPADVDLTRRIERREHPVAIYRTLFKGKPHDLTDRLAWTQDCRIGDLVNACIASVVYEADHQSSFKSLTVDGGRVTLEAGGEYVPSPWDRSVVA